MPDLHSDTRWLVHIGAGKTSVPILAHARAQGWSTLVFDLDPQAPGVIHAERFEAIGRDDETAMRSAAAKLACEQRIAGCLTSSSAEACLRAAARIREDQGLPGLGCHATEVLLDRSAWKQRLTGAGLATPDSRILASHGDLEEFLSLHPNALLKPAAGGRGSRGVAQVKSGDPRSGELFDGARAASTSDQVLAESFVHGDEYSIDLVVRNGRVEPLQIGRKYSALNLRGTLPTGYAWGAPCPGQRADQDPQWRRLEEVAIEACKALGVDASFVSFDVIDDGERIHIIDVGPMCDAKVDRALVFSGLDFPALACAVATGGTWQPDFQAGAITRGHALRFIYPEASGRLEHLADAVPGPRPLDIPVGARVSSRDAHAPAPSRGTDRFQVEWERESGGLAQRPHSVADMVAYALVESEDRNSAWLHANQIDPHTLFHVDEGSAP